MTSQDHGALVAADHGLTRNPHWPFVAKAHILKQPGCLTCGLKNPINVHHKYPFHFVILLGRPDLELDERNLFTLDTLPTDQHHILLGHLDDYQSYNPRLEYFVNLCRGLLASQIRAMHEWQEAVKQRPKRFGAMSTKEKDALRDELDRLMPCLNSSVAHYA